ncbi:MAG: hypothetical protein ACJ8C7_16485, partial [Microvirga sp.]
LPPASRDPSGARCSPVTAYVVTALVFEERDLVALFGEEYRSYSAARTEAAPETLVALTPCSWPTERKPDPAGGARALPAGSPAAAKAFVRSDPGVDHAFPLPATMIIDSAIKQQALVPS